MLHMQYAQAIILAALTAAVCAFIIAAYCRWRAGDGQEGLKWVLRQRDATAFIFPFMISRKPIVSGNLQCGWIIAIAAIIEGDLTKVWDVISTITAIAIVIYSGIRAERWVDREVMKQQAMHAVMAP